MYTVILYIYIIPNINITLNIIVYTHTYIYIHEKKTSIVHHPSSIITMNPTRPWQSK